MPDPPIRGKRVSLVALRFVAENDPEKRLGESGGLKKLYRFRRRVTRGCQPALTPWTDEGLMRAAMRLAVVIWGERPSLSKQGECMRLQRDSEPLRRLPARTCRQRTERHALCRSRGQ